MVEPAVLRRIAAIYRESKKKKDINWFTEHVCRPPAAVVTYLLSGSRITPNQVTFLSLVVCAGACGGLLLWPGRPGAIGAVALLEASYILDCVDGQLARLRKQSSVVGHLLDFLMDEIKAFLLFAAVAARLWLATDEDLYLLAGLGGLAALASGISITSFMRRPEYGAAPPTADGQPAVTRRRHGPVGLALGGFEHACRMVIHYPQYIWLCAIFDRLDLYFWAYGLVNVLYLGYTLLGLCWRLGRFDAPAAP
jgi:hypothetical protein